MSFNHEAVAALPAAPNTEADKALLRALVTRRLAYALAASETNSDFISVDPDTGTQPLYIVKHGTIFQLDPDDTTTADDDATCLVTGSGKRYKSDSIAYPWSVLDKDLVEQPETPSVGNSYLLPASPTGTDWSGKGGRIAIYTLAGWRFAIVPIGRPIYVEDEIAFYHRNALGTWVAGLGSIILSANTVPVSKLIGAGASFTLRVENQTTNDPPGTAAVGVVYIIGSVPTGAWASNPGKLAICEVVNTFTIYTPATGDVVHDKALSIKVEWNGTAWVPSGGNLIAFRAAAFVQSGSLTAFGVSSNYSYLAGTAPDRSTQRGSRVTTGITHTARSTNNRLRLRTTGVIKIATNVWTAMFRDSVNLAIAWTEQHSVANESLFCEFLITPPDTSEHTYYFAIGRDSGETPDIERMQFTLEELAQS